MALARRGYGTATSVQAAVLAPELAGRDLLVSSQTGSGKTIAFGLLIADSLGTEASRGGALARALVVAPTRELAAQVGGELGWLFADAKTRLGVFTGGTAVGPDLRALRLGLDVVVGTPGRLVDLHRRGALDLSALTVLVLDEADEMLDLGFKEDLEYLLSKSPASRRTVLFSATLPRPIERLAAAYQRQAVRVDPRPGGHAEEHADIRYVAHLVRASDRLAAVVNVLLTAGDGKAIVFCRTRESVSLLHQRLVDRGFRTAAIAGDRAQGERDRAIEALRDGRARVLVATNVAARGLDLPDVDVVIHADLPENVDSLTHRSGRTGRAGKKGTSVVIADSAERRKAERLLSGSRTKVQWTPPPMEADVRRVAHERLASLLIEEAKSAGSAEGRGDDAIDEFAALLRARLAEKDLVKLLLRRETARLPGAMPIHPVDLGRHDGPGGLPVSARAGAGPDARSGWDGAVLFRINLGAAAKAEPKWLLPLICRRGGVTRKEVGAIRVGPDGSTFEISAQAAGDFALAASRSDPRAPHVEIVPAQGLPSRPHAPPPPSRPHAPPPSSSRPHAPPPPSRPHAPPPSSRPHARPHGAGPRPPAPPQRLYGQGHGTPRRPNGQGHGAPLRPYSPRPKRPTR